METPHMKDCPFCGRPVDMKDSDTLYPNGIGWKDHPDIGIRGYHSFREVPKEQWCYSIHCVTTSGGCGAEISGDSKQECIDKWNTRTLDNIIAGAEIHSDKGYREMSLEEYEARMKDHPYRHQFGNKKE